MSVPVSNKYLKFTYWNSCDLGRVIFSNGFQFWFYLDALVTEPEELIFEDVEKDGNEKDIKTFIRTVKRYTIVTPLIPEYMVDAINSMKLHDNIEIKFTNGESLTVTKDQITTETEYFDDSTCFAKVIIKFDFDETIVKVNCCDDLETECQEPVDCDVFGVLYYPDFLTWTGIHSVYPAATLNDIFISIVRIPGEQNIGYVYANYENGLCDYRTLEGDYTTADCGNCPDVGLNDFVLTSDGQYWLYSDPIWMQEFVINVIDADAPGAHPGYAHLLTATGRSLPGTFIQMQYRDTAFADPWHNLGDPITVDDFMTIGFNIGHDLTGTYEFRVHTYNYACAYTDMGWITDPIVIP